MEKFALLARVETKPGKEEEVLAFLKSALPLAEAEPDTVRWYALQLGPSRKAGKPILAAQLRRL